MKTGGTPGYSSDSDVPDYGLPAAGKLLSKPRVVEVLNEPCSNQNCQCDTVCMVEVLVEMPTYMDGKGVGRYKGCPACAWSSSMIVRGIKRDDEDEPIKLNKLPKKDGEAA